MCPTTNSDPFPPFLTGISAGIDAAYLYFCNNLLENKGNIIVQNKIRQNVTALCPHGNRKKREPPAKAIPVNVVMFNFLMQPDVMILYGGPLPKHSSDGQGIHTPFASTL